jgi:hypothetical protein
VIEKHRTLNEPQQLAQRPRKVLRVGWGQLKSPFMKWIASSIFSEGLFSLM